jgi:hypothetical protein
MLLTQYSIEQNLATPQRAHYCSLGCQGRPDPCVCSENYARIPHRDPGVTECFSPEPNRDDAQ